MLPKPLETQRTPGLCLSGAPGLLWRTRFNHGKANWVLVLSRRLDQGGIGDSFLEEVEHEIEEPASFLEGWPGFREAEGQVAGFAGTSVRSRDLEMGKNRTGGECRWARTEGSVTSSLMES